MVNLESRLEGLVFLLLLLAAHRASAAGPGFTAQKRMGHTTGDQWEEIQKRLGGIDTRELVSVADAREVMKEANRGEWRERRQAAWNAQQKRD